MVGFKKPFSSEDDPRKKGEYEVKFGKGPLGFRMQKLPEGQLGAEVLEIFPWDRPLTHNMELKSDIVF